MSRLFKKTLSYYYKIFEQIYNDSTLPICDIAVNTDICRNTVSEYLKKSSEKVIIGPCLRMKPAANYKEYVYLMNFTYPYEAYKGLREFPYVLYAAILFGDWNIMVITNRLLDFSNLVGFQNMVYQGMRGVSYTPKVGFTSWKESLRRIDEYLEEFTPVYRYKDRKKLPVLPWGEDEWKLFSVFNDDVRKKVTPTIQEINVRYEAYGLWKKGLETYCTQHTGFYPGGFDTYMHHYFLFSTECEGQLKKLWSFLPTTPFCMEVDNHVLVMASIKGSEVMRRLLCTTAEMKARKMVEEVWYATLIFQHRRFGNYTRDLRLAFDP